MRVAILIFLVSLTLRADEVRNQMAELHVLKEQMRKQVFERSRRIQETQRLTLELSEQAQNIKEIEKNLRNLEVSSRERLVSLYKKRRSQETQNLLTLEHSQNFLRKTFFVQLMNRADKNRARQLEEIHKSLLKEKNKFQMRIQHLYGLRKSNELTLQKLKDQEQLQRQILLNLKDSLMALDMNENEAFDFSIKRGNLLSPVRVAGDSRYGLFKDQKSGLQVHSSGTYFLAENADVKSAFDGVVKFVGTLNYWGPTLILDHGHSFFTVYSNLKNLSVSLGDKVHEQQKLAEVGNLQYDRKYNFYFEVRHFSEPQNPKEWFKAGEIR